MEELTSKEKMFMTGVFLFVISDAIKSANKDQIKSEVDKILSIGSKMEIEKLANLVNTMMLLECESIEGGNNG